MPFEVTEPTIELHEESKFYYGDLVSVNPEEGNFGPQLKWTIVLDEDGTFTDDQGNEYPRETWTWCSQKLTTHEKNKFRKYAKGLLGREPEVGELFDEQHYTTEYYQTHPEADPEKLTGRKQPWRVAVMFEHTKKSDGTPTERVEMLVSEAKVKGA